MRLRCRLREIREQMPRKPDGKKVSLADIAAASGVSQPMLSQIERGTLLPKDAHVEALEHAYGVPETEWYDRRALLAIEADDDE